MKKATLLLLGCIVWIPLWAFCKQLHADETLPPPQAKEVWSDNRRFFAAMDPKSMTTTVYRVETNGKRTEQWTMQGWFREAYLSSDGEHLIVGRDGGRLLPMDVTKEEPIIRFYVRGRLLNTVSLGELITNLSKLKRTASHYDWGRYVGFDPFDAKESFFVETVEGTYPGFDITTGKPLPPTKQAPAEEKKADPAPKQAEAEVYIPKDLDDCFVELRRILPEKTVEQMKNGPEKDMVGYHHGLGRWLRNNWGLWKGSRLSKWFNDKGIQHPDDMSGIILDSFWRHLNGQPIKLDEQIKHYQDYWKRVKEEHKQDKN